MIQLVFFLILTLNLEGAVGKKVVQHGQRSTNYVLVRSQQLMHRLNNISYKEVRQVLRHPKTIGFFGLTLVCCAIARLKRPVEAKVQQLPQIQKNPERPQAVFPANVKPETSEEWRMASELLGEIEAAGGLREFILKGISNNESRNAAVEAIQRSGLSEKETFAYENEKYQFNEDELAKLVVLKGMITELIAPLQKNGFFRVGGSAELVSKAKLEINNLMMQLFYTVIGEGKTLILAYKIIIASENHNLQEFIEELKEQLNYMPVNIYPHGIEQISLIEGGNNKNIYLKLDDEDESDKEDDSYVMSSKEIAERIIVHRNPQFFGHAFNSNPKIGKKIKSLARLLEKEKTNKVWFLRTRAFGILGSVVRNIENGTLCKFYEFLNHVADTNWKPVLQNELEKLDCESCTLDAVNNAMQQLVAEVRHTRTELTRLRAWGLRSN